MTSEFALTTCLCYGTRRMPQGFIDKLFAAGAHFGYAPKYRHPSAARFVFGSKGGVELIDLEKTSALLGEALQFLKQIASSRGAILFVGGKAEVSSVLERAAHRLNQPYVAGRWIGGTLTNFSEIKKRLDRLAELSDKREKGELAKFTKKERLLIDRDITELEAMFGGLRGMEKLPTALLVIDPSRERIAVDEAVALNIPVVALMNTDCDSKGVTCPVPGNDASVQTVALVLEEMVRAIEEGMKAQTPIPEVQS